MTDDEKLLARVKDELCRVVLRKQELFAEINALDARLRELDEQVVALALVEDHAAD